MNELLLIESMVIDYEISKCCQNANNSSIFVWMV